MAHPWFQEAVNLRPELVAWRRALHQMPEVGLSLPQTAAFVRERLNEMHIPYTYYEKSSNIVALIGHGSPCIMLRSDMDALPVEEQTGLPYAATNGNMHACGHDMHCATLLGAAKLLKAHESELRGTVKLLFQSGEEIFAGARAAISEGVLENPKVDAAFAMHVGGNFDCGVVAWGDTVMSSAYGFKIKLKGKGTHGSTPELGIDPINTAVHVYLALQELIAREVGASDECALTIGKFAAGSVANVIPETAELEGTLRTFKPEVRAQMIARIREVTEHVAAAYRTEAVIEELYDVPMCRCDEQINASVLGSIASLDAGIPALKLYHAMGSEDFSFYTDKVPCAFMAIGAGVEDRSKWVAQHNPSIQFHENALPEAAAIYAKAAADYLAAKGTCE